MAKENERFASGHQGGNQITYELDLTGRAFQSSLFSLDGLAFSRYQVWVKTIGATGIIGDFTLREGPTKNISDHTTLGAGTLTAAADTVLQQGGTFNSSFISVDLSTITTLPTVGKILIIITLKDN